MSPRWAQNLSFISWGQKKTGISLIPKKDIEWVGPSPIALSCLVYLGNMQTHVWYLSKHLCQWLLTRLLEAAYSVLIQNMNYTPLQHYCQVFFAQSPALLYKGLSTGSTHGRLLCFPGPYCPWSCHSEQFVVLSEQIKEIFRLSGCPAHLLGSVNCP